MSSTSKTSDNFQGVSSDYATYTNDVDKPYPLAKPEDEDPDRPADDNKTAEAKAPAKRPAAKSPADK